MEIRWEFHGSYYDGYYVLFKEKEDDLYRVLSPVAKITNFKKTRLLTRKNCLKQK